MQHAIQAENELAHTVIGLAIEIHKALGPGLTEDAYRDCLMYELKEHGIFAEAGKMMPVQYKNLQLNYGYKVDLLVEGKLVVEIETVEQISDNQVQLLLRHLKTGGFKLGLIINFNSVLLKNGIRRVTNHRPAGEEERSILEESVL
ncbi:MAG: GxxExxY protein [Bacteroidetes bacterium]|nr:GxxExxY protein [Bacteroidota bacterium]